MVAITNQDALGSLAADLLYTPPPAAEPFLGLTKESAGNSGVPWQLLTRQQQEESNFDPNAVSPVGAVGIAQIMPKYYPRVDLKNPTVAIPLQASIMADNYNRFGSWAQALAAYNAGGGNVHAAITAATNAGDPSQWLLYLPTSAANQRQTQRYVGQILADVPLESMPAGAIT